MSIAATTPVRCLVATGVLVSGLLGVPASAAVEPGVLETWAPEPAPWVVALEEGRHGDARVALNAARESVEKRDDASTDEHLALADGYLALGDAERASKVLGPLVASDPFGVLLDGRATEASEPSPRDLLVAERLAMVDAATVGDALAASARRLRLQLLARREAWEEVRQIVDGIPAARRTTDERWWAARSRATPAERHAALLALWREAPDGPWALAARRIASDLRSRHPELRVPSLTISQRLDLARGLQRAGLHDLALEETDSLEPTPEVLRLRAESAYRVRRNDLCVETADTMRRLHPGDSRLPETVVFALRALRRSDRTEEIRERALWLADRRPADAWEALFQLGDHLGNVRDPAEGLALLDRVADGAARGADDALWKGAWIARSLHGDEAARSRLERLARRFAETGWEAPALYWVGRWATTPEERAAAWTRLLTVDPDGYYGRLAAERQGPDGGASAAPTRGTLLRVPTETGVPAERLSRVRDLVARGLSSLAVLELGALDRRTPALDLALARLHARSGRPERAVSIVETRLRRWLEAVPPSGDSRLWRLALPLWPRPETFAGALAKASAEGSVPAIDDPFLVLALVRQESRYRADAVSSAGALGLLQLMPSTAEGLAGNLGLPRPGRRELFDPVLNVRLGVAELGGRLAEWGGAFAPAIASYNAGSAAVRPWWTERARDLDLDEWIETIPYRETRLYVKKVLENWALYHDVWGEPVRILDRLVSDDALSPPTTEETR